MSTPGPAAKKPLTFKKRVQAYAAIMVGLTLIHLLGKSLRIWTDVRENVDKARGGPDGGPVLLALWHGVHFAPLYDARGNDICVVTSTSADGDILTRIINRLGLRCVRGSSSRGGRRALIDMVRTVDAGAHACIAVDGPRGPARKVKPGIILLAKLTGRIIIPIASTPSVYWRFQSWDRFRLPMPFSRVLITAGDPIRVPPDADHALIEELRVQLEQTLERMQADLEARARPWVWRLPDRRPRDKVYHPES